MKSNLRKTILAGVTVVLMGAAATAAAAGRGPSTKEEREKAVRVAHALEAAPLDKSLSSDRKWALLWLIEVPDVHVTLCPRVLGDFLGSKYKYESELFGQLTLSSAAYVIEHPEEAGDPVAQYMGGVEGVLKAYQAILQEKPKAKSKVLDDLLEKQAKGELKNFVQDASKACK